MHCAEAFQIQGLLNALLHITSIASHTMQAHLLLDAHVR